MLRFNTSSSSHVLSFPLDFPWARVSLSFFLSPRGETIFVGKTLILQIFAVGRLFIAATLPLGKRNCFHLDINEGRLAFCTGFQSQLQCRSKFSPVMNYLTLNAHPGSELCKVEPGLT